MYINGQVQDMTKGLQSTQVAMGQSTLGAPHSYVARMQYVPPPLRIGHHCPLVYLMCCVVCGMCRCMLWRSCSSKLYHPIKMPSSTYYLTRSFFSFTSHLFLLLDPCVWWGYHSCFCHLCPMLGHWGFQLSLCFHSYTSHIQSGRHDMLGSVKGYVTHLYQVVKGWNCCLSLASGCSEP